MVVARQVWQKPNGGSHIAMYMNPGLGTILPSQFKFDELAFCSHLNSNRVIATKFCVWHDSYAVVACTKICYDQIACYWITAKGIFPSNLNCEENSLVKRVPGAHDTNDSHRHWIHIWWTFCFALLKFSIRWSPHFARDTTAVFESPSPSLVCLVFCILCSHMPHIYTLITTFMGPTWGPSGAHRTQVGPMSAPWTLLSGYISKKLWERHSVINTLMLKQEQHEDFCVVLSFIFYINIE